MSRIILLIVLSLSVFVAVICDDEQDDPFHLMYCLFVQKGCDDAKVAQLQMQVAAYIATMDDKEASSLGGFYHEREMAGINSKLK